MRNSNRHQRRLLGFGLAMAVLIVSPAWADLDSYVKAPDACFGYKVEQTMNYPGVGSVLIVQLTSQEWQGIPWRHWLYVIRPEKVTHPDLGLLVISGGSTRKEPPQKLPGDAQALVAIAQKTGSVIAVLSQVPNQPLFGNLKEDALIAHTFQKFLETKDETWPCLLPMTKSAVRGMDTVQALLKEKFTQEIKRFVVTGASKRGWTTWLTGAIDPRVCAIAPMVIDTLNMAKQMPLQVLSFGTYSEEIKDYTTLNLPGRMGEPGSRRLMELVDPYSYLKKLSMPKLIVLGTNDRYWPVDAAKLYFGDLPGEKYLSTIPNVGHGLGPPAVDAVSAFYQSVILDERRPRFTWELKKEKSQALLSIAPQDPPVKVELWKAASDTRDFRDARWSPSALEKSADSSYQAKVEVPPEGFTAILGRLTYQSSLGHDYALSTNVEVLGEKARVKS